MANLLRKITLVLAMLAIPAEPTAARADSAANARAEAKKHFDRAKELNEDGQVAEAVIELQRCYELAPHHTVLYNLGQAYITLAKPVEAVAALQRYLNEGGKAIKPARRTEVEQEIARQKTRIAALEIRGLPDGAVVTIDGDEAGKAPLVGPVRVGVGKHVVAATAAGYEPGEARIAIAGEDSRVVELKLLPRVGQPAAVVGAGVGQGRPAPAAAPVSAAAPAPTPAPAPAPVPTPTPVPPPTPAPAPTVSSKPSTSEPPAPGTSPPPAQGEVAASDEASNWSRLHFEFGIFGGGHFFTSKHSLGSYPGIDTNPPPGTDWEGISPRSSGVFGGRLGMYFNRWIGLEAELDATPTETRDGQTSMWVVGYRVSMIVNLTDSYVFQPFILAGMGGLTSLVDKPDYVSNDTWGFLHAGLGFKVGLTPRIGLRVDARIMGPWTVLPGIPKGDRMAAQGPDWELLGSLFINFGGRDRAHISR